MTSAYCIAHTLAPYCHTDINHALPIHKRWASEGRASLLLTTNAGLGSNVSLQHASCPIFHPRLDGKDARRPWIPVALIQIPMLESSQMMSFSVVFNRSLLPWVTFKCFGPGCNAIDARPTPRKSFRLPASTVPLRSRCNSA